MPTVLGQEKEGGRAAVGLGLNLNLHHLLLRDYHASLFSLNGPTFLFSKSCNKDKERTGQISSIKLTNHGDCSCPQQAQATNERSLADTNPLPPRCPSIFHSLGLRPGPLSLVFSCLILLHV